MKSRRRSRHCRSRRRTHNRTRRLRGGSPQHIITATHNPFPFFFMGCWNKESPSQARVAAKMASLPRPAALILAGDNVYPEKVAGNKVYSLNRLRRGHAQVAALNIPLYVSLGNHNVADPAILEAEMHELPWTIPNNYYCLRFPRHNLQIVILDTNLYDDSSTAAARSIQEEWLANILPHAPTIIVQHEPIIGLKQKKSALTVALPSAANLIRILTAHPPIAILAADIHNYQDLELASPPTQEIIVGTGGADLDPLPSNIPQTLPPYIAQIHSAKYTNGFLEVTGISNAPTPRLEYVFHDVLATDDE